MPHVRALAAAVGLGILAGALCALWATLAEAQGVQLPSLALPSGRAVAQASGADRRPDAGAPGVTPGQSPRATAAP